MRKPSRIVALTAMLALAFLWMLLKTPVTTSASVSFTGHVTNNVGLLVPAFAITNTGDTPVRRWDFYTIEGRQTGTASEQHVGPDAYLAPGQSEVIALPSSVTQKVWRVTFYLTRDDWRRKVNDAASRSPFVSRLLPEQFRNLPVEQQVHSDWISE
jgi:hypothetical protein